MNPNFPDRGADRMPPIPVDRLTPAQARAAQALASGPRGAVFGPFVPMLRSPEFLDRAQRLGEFIRYDSVVPHALRELAILVTARHWDQGYEWWVHAPIARASGISSNTIEAIEHRRRPTTMSKDEAAVHDFCFALHRQEPIDDASYVRVCDAFGEAGTVELTGLCGYYAMLAMLLNVSRTPVPD